MINYNLSRSKDNTPKDNPQDKLFLKTKQNI